MIIPKSRDDEKIVSFCQTSTFHAFHFFDCSSYVTEVSSCLYYRTLLTPILFTYTIGMAIFCQFNVNLFTASIFISNLFTALMFSNDLFQDGVCCWLWNCCNVLGSTIFRLWAWRKNRGKFYYPVNFDL